MYRRTSRHQRRSTTSRIFAPRALPPELLRRVEVDPVFQVMSADQQTWFEPYAGRAIPASLGRTAAAREYLLENETAWRNGQSTLPLARLEYERWRHDLIKLLPTEPRLRIFGRGGAWFDPYAGEFIAGITRDEGKITFRTVSAIALHLAGSERARGGKLLEPKAIADLLRKEIARGHAPVLDEAMAKASTVQRQMLPELPHLDGFAIAVHFRAHHGVSGDFYDCLTLPDGRTLFVIGDVSGHGLQAALVVATALKTLRFVARREGSLAELLVRFNDEIKRDLIPGQFITLAAMALDAATGDISVVRAGHHPGLLVSMQSDAILRRVGKSGMAIGLATGPIFAQTLREERLTLQEGDVLLHYTDGLTEAVSPEGEAYGEGRLYASLLAHFESPPQQFVDAIAEDVSRFSHGPVGDDITILCLAALVSPEPSRDEGGSTATPPPAGAARPATGPEAAPEASAAPGLTPDPDLHDDQPSETGEIEAPASA